MANKIDPLEAAWQVKPNQFDAARDQCIRTRIDPDQPIHISSESSSRWQNSFRILTSQTSLTCSGRFNLTLQVTPAQVRIGQNRWTSLAGKLGRGSFHIPIIDDFDGGNSEPINLHIRCTLPFLHPFVPMHLKICLEDQVVFTQGKFAG